MWIEVIGPVRLRIEGKIDDGRFFITGESKSAGAGALGDSAGLRAQLRHIKRRTINLRRLIQVVHFHERDPGRVPCSAHDGGIVAGVKCCHDGRFAVVSRRDGARGDLRLLVAAPTVVLRHEHAIPVVKRNIGSNMRPERGTPPRLKLGPFTRTIMRFATSPWMMKPPIIDVISGQHASTRGDIPEACRRGSGIEIVNFHDGDAGGVVGPTHNRGVTADCERGDQGRITIVPRSQAGSDDAPFVAKCANYRWSRRLRPWRRAIRGSDPRAHPGPGARDRGRAGPLFSGPSP